MSDEIERLLSEVGMSDDEVLRTALVRLHDDATSQRPVPSAELSQLMVARRSPSLLRRHRGALTAVIVIGTLGAGVTAAAASPDVRSGVQHVFQIVTGTGRSSTVPPTSPSPSPTAHRETTPPEPQPSSTPAAPTGHPTTGVGNGAPKPTPGPAHTSPGRGNHSPTPTPGSDRGNRP